MPEFNCGQIIETIDTGLVVLDREMRVKLWNRWLVYHSGIASEEIVGRPIQQFFPNLEGQKFHRFVRSVFSFGNYAYFSQKLHKYLIPLENPHSLAEGMPYMQQSCSAGPIHNESGVIDHIFIAIQDVTQYVAYEQKLLEMSKQDHLTKLYNRSYLDRRLGQEIERARRHGHPLSIFMIDIDYFKAINDTRGHLCGDQTLRELAVLLQRLVRVSDVVGRYGGEEFCCVLPDTPAASAAVLGERLREQVEQMELRGAGFSFRITISLGVAEYGEGADTLERLIEAADTALYSAKKSGRNRVVCAPVTHPSPLNF